MSFAVQRLGHQGGFAQVVRTYTSGTGATETVPAGATSVTIEVWHGGAAGARDVAGGAAWGGGSGAYASRTIAVAPGNTFTYTVAASVAGRGTDGAGNNGNLSSVTGTVAGGSVSISGTAAQGGVSGSAGTGGTATGGTTNTAGGNGTASRGGNAPNGGAGGGVGTAGSAPGGGGGPQNSSGSSGGGAAGQVRFTYN